MDGLKTSCVHRGNTFFGAVEVAGSGDDRVVRVRYNGGEREAPLDGFPTDVLAHLLLRELVLQDVAQITAHQGEEAEDRPPVARPATDGRLLDL